MFFLSYSKIEVVIVDNDLIKKYKDEMIKMYGGKIKMTEVKAEIPKNEQNMDRNLDGMGELIGIVTTVRSLYPVVNAKVTVFKGDAENPEIISVDYTDQSGKTESFKLATPAKSLSQSAENKELPYALYNLKVEADGYITNIHLNIPVFSDTVSLQRSDMLLLETAGVNKGPRIFDEGQNYGL